MLPVIKYILVSEYEIKILKYYNHYFEGTWSPSLPSVVNSVQNKNHQNDQIFEKK